MVTLFTTLTAMAQSDVTCNISGMTTTLSNGLIEVKINSNGQISLLKYNGINVVGTNTVYFDFTASNSGFKGEPLRPSKVDLVKSTADYAEVLYSNTTGDIQFQQGYIMRKDIKGVYTYIIANGTEKSENILIQEARVCARLMDSMLDGYVDDKMQGIMPSRAEMAVAEKEENTVQDATYYLEDGSVYTKYNWAQYIERDSVHGLMHTNGFAGLWNIHCSKEWYPGGPMKQELTVHATSKSPITIQMIQGEHFGTQPVAFKKGERKLYGPFLLYANTSNSKDRNELIADAKAMAHQQEQEWPFQWFENELYPLDRSTVNGRINVTTGQGSDSIRVVLAEPGELYVQNKGYMFWALTDKHGNFSIKNVRKGTYALHAFATKGDITDELEVADITVEDGETSLGTIDWTPACYEDKLFQIGENNRMSDGFKYSDHNRAYGLWDSVPSSLTFTVGTSNEATDWYYGQVKNGQWTVKFNSDKTYSGNAYLTISAAAVTNSPKLTISINGTNIGSWSPSPNDGAIYRSAILGGRHHLYVLKFSAIRIKQGANTLTLNMSGIGKNGGILYDCIKMEAGPQVISDGICQHLQAPVGQRQQIFTLSGQKIADTTTGKAQLNTAKKGIYIVNDGSRSKKIINR